MPARCELPLRSGEPCAVVATGRCAECERAFCDSHRGKTGSTIFRDIYSGLCADCEETSKAKQRTQRAAEQAAIEEYPWREAERLAQVEADLQQVLAVLRTAGHPGAEWRYQRTYAKKHLFTSNTKLKKVEIGMGWRVGELDFRWTAPHGDYNLTEQVQRREAMVLTSTGSVVHAELDDLDWHQGREKFVRTAHQLQIVVERLRAYGACQDF